METQILVDIDDHNLAAEKKIGKFNSSTGSVLISSYEKREVMNANASHE